MLLGKEELFISKLLKQWSKVGILVSIGLLFAGALIWAGHTFEKRHSKNSNYNMSAIPTIMMHGWSSSLRAEEPLIKTAADNRIITEEVVIHVTKANKLKVQGKLTGKKNNPIILVQFDNNRVGEFRYARGLHRIVKYLQKEYDLEKFNVIGHSMGSYAWAYYALRWGADPALPQLNKMVLLAGPYDGILNKGHANQPTNGELAGLWDDSPRANTLGKNGKPKIIHDEYKVLLKRRDDFPKNARVLNIYGDLEDGTDSDGLVSVPSARSLRYLVEKRAKSYEEYKVEGQQGQHSNLHIDNEEVSKEITNYLWKK